MSKRVSNAKGMPSGNRAPKLTLVAAEVRQRLQEGRLTQLDRLAIQEHIQHLKSRIPQPLPRVSLLSRARQRVRGWLGR